MGFPGYFLIVSDFIKWAKKNNYKFSTTGEFLENWNEKNKN